MGVTRFVRVAVLLPCLLLLAACATNRSYINLSVPSGPTAAMGEKVAVIDSVSDQRRFEEDPDEPSTPSLKKGGNYALDIDGRKHAVARKRNGYGMAIGDIQLQGEQTVETIVRDLVKDGLQQHGYRVLEPGASAPEGALRVGVTIQEFWSWLTPGFWAVDMEAKIKALLKLSGAHDAELEVAAYGKKSAPTGRDDNFKQAYDRAFADYLAKQKAAMDQAGL